MHSYEVFQSYEQFSWQLKSIAWADIRLDRVRPEYVQLARSAAMGECNSVAAVHGFLNESCDDYDFASFTSIWGYQELQHHFAFRSWLEHVGEQVDPARVESTRAPYPAGRTHAATLATNVISELTVCHVYQQLSQRVEEPILAEILARASQDEARHAREFQSYARRRLTRFPEELSSVLETLYIYAADPEKPLKHPVSVFKGALPELADYTTIDDGFAYSLAMDSELATRLRGKLFRTFSDLTGRALDSPRSIRRCLAEALAGNGS